MKCEAVTCQYNKVENSLYGYCQKESQTIKDNYTCLDYKEREQGKTYCPNCNKYITPDITEYEEGTEGFKSGKMCPICEEFIY